jgi:ANTAR domain
MSLELPQSLYPLAVLAAREAGADGAAIYRISAGGCRELKLSWGALVPETAEFPLCVAEDVAGLLTFIFRSGMTSPETRSWLEQIAEVIEDVWRLAALPSSYALEAARIARMETALADSKIADRARGLLASGAQQHDAIETILRHAKSVLRPSPLQTALSDLSQEVEREIAERELASRAKAVLQSRYGMSEDQAHVHLRLVSRQSRRRLHDVARELLQENRPTA